MIEWMQNFDQGIFQFFQETFSSNSLDFPMMLISNAMFYSPFLIFLAVLLFLDNEKKGSLTILCALGTWVLAYQVSGILGSISHKPAPYVVEHIINNHKLPAFIDEFRFTLADWVSASLLGTVLFAIKYNQSIPTKWALLFLLIPLLAGFARIYTGAAYPLDIPFGYAVGILIFWLMSKFRDNLARIVVNDG